MATGRDVLSYLIPNGGWVISGDDYENIEFLEADPITKKEFEAGFAKVDAWKIEQEKQMQIKKQELLNRLGITEEEAKLLLS